MYSLCPIEFVILILGMSMEVILNFKLSDDPFPVHCLIHFQSIVWEQLKMWILDVTTRHSILSEKQVKTNL